MKIAGGLGFYWNTPTSAQIGLDPRIALRLHNVTLNELRLIDTLTSSQTPAEFRRLAKRHRVTAARAQEILASLSEQGIIADEEPYFPDSQLRQRIQGADSRGRNAVSIEFSRFDALGAGIAIHLAMAGISSIATPDATRVGEYDYPLISRRYAGIARHKALHSMMATLNPGVRVTPPTNPHFAIVTGFHAADPFATSRYLARGIPVLQACIEEVDICVGPVLEPQSSPCPGCIHLHRIDSTPKWENLAPQALAGKPLFAEISSLNMAVSLAAREVLNYLDYGSTSLTSYQWIVPPSPRAAKRVSVIPHPRCNCTELAEPKGQLTGSNTSLQ
ncbi:MAG: hypothetical protein PUK40_05030 [Actinomycetaceae bacterium]|nr:hypothetical protein [Arcanobacterium sp.]MDD7505294.1 hypothetical protein [Actinomycetaceae bacterium]MDY6143520.1 hypothetical protein [Arcanobacterium sp.]